MMPTQSSSARAFAQFDLTRVPSPCFVIDEMALRHNLEILQDIATQSGAHILAALKACSMWSLAPIIADYLQGTCASGLWEAQLARRYYSGTLSTYAPAFKASEAEAIAQLSDHMIFNAPAQLHSYSQFRTHNMIQAGLRINPQYSTVEIEKYDPCAVSSRLGWPVDRLEEIDLAMIDGLHMHILCEQDFAPLLQGFTHIAPALERVKGKLDWFNFGGGHLLTRPDYQREELIAFLRRVQSEFSFQALLEPGMAVVYDTGILVGEVLDILPLKTPTAILDISPACHMPDVLEAPYRPALLDEAISGTQVALGGPSCLAGDMIGTYQFATLPEAGSRLAFLDQAHYSMVRMTSFNGVKLPAIALWNSETDALQLMREFDFSDFAGRLS